MERKNSHNVKDENQEPFQKKKRCNFAYLVKFKSDFSFGF